MSCLLECTVRACCWLLAVCSVPAYLVPGATDDGREHGTRSIISSEAGLAHTRTIVHNQSLHVTVRHSREREKREEREKSRVE